MIISANGSDYKPVPAGSYVATCVRVIDLGTQTSNYQGQEKSQRKVLISWEIPEVEVETDDGVKPALISSSYTASLHEKASLRKTLESWRGRTFTGDELKGFDLKNVLGAPCMLNVVHTEKDGGSVYANVAAVMALPKQMPKPDPVHDLVNFDLDDFTPQVFDSLGNKLREKIMATPEYKAATGGSDENFHQADQVGVAGNGSDFSFDDEIPF